jgi:hypothetical protein
LPSSGNNFGRVVSAYIELAVEGEDVIGRDRGVEHCPIGSDYRVNEKIRENYFGGQVVLEIGDE